MSEEYKQLNGLKPPLFQYNGGTFQNFCPQMQNTAGYGKKFRSTRLGKVVTKDCRSAQSLNAVRLSQLKQQVNKHRSKLP